MSADVGWVCCSGKQEREYNDTVIVLPLVNKLGWVERKVRSRESRESKDWMIHSLNMGSQSIAAEPLLSFWPSLLYHTFGDLYHYMQDKHIIELVNIGCYREYLLSLEAFESHGSWSFASGLAYDLGLWDFFLNYVDS